MLQKVDMAIKQKDSQHIDFLNKEDFDVETMLSVLRNHEYTGDVPFKDFADEIMSIVSNQEIQWLRRNKPENVVDYLVYRYKFKKYPSMRKLEKFPLHLLIEPTSICNLRCIMCFQSDSSFHTSEYMGMIDFGFFRELVDQAVENNCKAMTLASRGEPTLHKNFGDMLSYCKDKFFELKINTNATVLTEDMCYEILDTGVDIVVFSIDSCCREEYERIRKGGRFEQVVENIGRFSRIREAYPEYRKTATRISGVYFMSSQSKEKFLNFWSGLVDAVVYNDAVPRWDSYNNTPLSYDKLCSLLWERMYVWYDGTCNPCDFDYKSKLKVGDAKKTLLKDIWLGEPYSKYRNMFLHGKREYLTPCNKCNIY